MGQCANFDLGVRGASHFLGPRHLLFGGGSMWGPRSKLISKGREPGGASPVPSNQNPEAVGARG